MIRWRLLLVSSPFVLSGPDQIAGGEAGGVYPIDVEAGRLIQIEGAAFAAALDGNLSPFGFHEGPLLAFDEAALAVLDELHGLARLVAAGIAPLGLGQAEVHQPLVGKILFADFSTFFEGGVDLAGDGADFGMGGGDDCRAVGEGGFLEIGNRFSPRKSIRCWRSSIS